MFSGEILQLLLPHTKAHSKQLVHTPHPPRERLAGIWHIRRQWLQQKIVTLLESQYSLAAFDEILPIRDAVSRPLFVTHTATSLR